jgi:DNA recombination protein RmuC
MLYVLLAVQFFTVVILIVLLLRKPAAAAENVDPRLAQLIAADLPTQFARLDARSESLDQHLRGESSALRREVLESVSTLGETQRKGLESFRTDNATAAERLRLAVEGQLTGLAQRLTAFTSDSSRLAIENRESLDSRLTQLGASQAEHQEKLRETVEKRLDLINQNNEKKLEEMRETVDEKLHKTLQNRLTESFGQVTDQLTKVHAGLGEMTKLSAGVDDLSRIFTNVKSRGTIGEVMLESLLKQILAPSQYIHNAKVKPNTQEIVEYAVKFPTPKGEMLLPIDSKFPREIWERLETAYETGTDIVSAGKAFESAIRNEGKKICEKYIAPPHTTAFAIMFLPTEGLYAEVMRRDGLQSDIQQNCRVTIAGPSTLSAILTSFQMGFHMLQMQEKGDEVWKVLANAQKQFGNMGVLMTKMESQVNTVQNTIQEVGKRTRVINKQLSDVHLEATDKSIPGAVQTGFDGLLPMLAANGDDAAD